jgi:hypothetical protein
MNRKGYFGHRILRPGDTLPSHIRLPSGDVLTISNIPRKTGLASHVADMKRWNIVMDAATIFARHCDFLTPQNKVSLSGAEYQNSGATGANHAAHALKRFTFKFDPKEKNIAEVYTRPGVGVAAVTGLQTMLGLVIDVPRLANQSIDQRLENNPQRLAQLKLVVGSSINSLPEARKLARELEFQRRSFDQDLLKSMQGGFGGDADLPSQYKALWEPPPFDETPEGAVDMIATMVEG